ncbi:MAG: class I SAM-dependent methyltransferase [Hyphomicrobiaceae bacterium]
MSDPAATSAADARFWDRAARKYAADPIKDMAGYERTLERSASYLSPSDTVLEIGCGTGTTALRLAPRVRRVVATDISPEMIAIARERVADAGCRNIELRVAPADGTAVETASMDAVMAFNVLHLTADRPGMIREIWRALKPGGLLISKTACLAEMTTVIRLAVPLMRAIGKAPSVVAFFDGAALTKDVEAGGFEIVETARHGSGRKDPRLFLVARKPAAP